MNWLATLIACGVGPTQARAMAPHVEAAVSRFRIDSGQQRAAFLAQALHESQMMTRMEESLWYKNPQRILSIFGGVKAIRDLGPSGAAALCRNPKGLALAAYSNRLGNGDPSSGDGWRFRGRGIFQLTGRANYMAAGDALGRPYKERPELVAEPLDAAMTAGWFWAANGCNALAGAGEFDKTTLRINKAGLGRAERQQLFVECLAAI